MMTELLTGKHIRLTAQDPAKDASAAASWHRDTNYTRLLESEPVTPPRVQDWREHFERELNPRFFPFAVRTMDSDRVIGFVVLMRVEHAHGSAYVGIGIGDTQDRGKGYGSEAMQLALDFGFQELNLHRVSLEAVATNAQAIRSYEKCGFVHEGQTRGTDFRYGVRTNLVSMGILRSEWEQKRRAVG